MLRHLLPSLATCVFAVLLNVAPASAQISTQGPGDGCAPYLDGTVNTHCLAIFTNLVSRDGTPGDWERLETTALAPATSPIATLAPLLTDGFGNEAYVAQEISMETPFAGSVDFLLSTEPRQSGIGARVETTGRLVQRADGLWHVVQIEQRTTCVAVASWEAHCP